MYNPKNIKLKDAAYAILTHVCDKACPFCLDLYRIYCIDITNPLVHKVSMSLDTLDTIIKELRKTDIKRVTLVGGEATLNPNFVEICKRLKWLSATCKIILYILL